MSNYCACSGGDEEYTIELNQQGPSGPQGPVGPEGFSPSISVKTNTDKTYVLTVVNKDGTFDTPNLYGELEKLNVNLTNLPNPVTFNGVTLLASEDGTPSIYLDTSKATVDTDGNLVFTASATDEEGTETFNYELVVNPTDQRLELHDNEGTVKVVAVTDEIAIVQSQLSDKLDRATYEADKATYATKEELASTDATVANLQTSVESNTTSIGSIRESLGNLTNTVINNATDIAALDSTKLESSNIIAGANVTIDRSGNNLTISSIGGGGGGGSSIDDGSTSSVTTWSSSKINSIADKIRETKNDNIFDISKFTVVGSPTVTDDGIASGFSNSNYLKLPTQTVVSLQNANDWEINLPISFADGTTTTRQEIFGGSTAYSLITRLWTDGHLFVVVNGITSTDKFTLSSKNGVAANTLYLIKIEVKDNVFSFYLNGELQGTQNLTEKVRFDDVLTLGRSHLTVNPFLGQIDLKQFSITVDGEKVFSGLMESTKPIYDKLSSTSSELSSFKLDTNNNFSAVESALNEKANLSDLASKQNVLTAGENITIEGNVISATGGTGGSGTQLTSSDGEISYSTLALGDNLVVDTGELPWTNPQMTSDSQDGYVASANYSSSESGSAIWKAFDKDTTTPENAFYTGYHAFPMWIMLECPEAVRLTSCMIMNEVATPANIRSGYIQGSNDGSTFDTLYTITDRPDTAGLQETYTIDNNIYYKYLRVYITEAYDAGFSIQEIEFSGFTKSSTTLTTLNVNLDEKQDKLTAVDSLYIEERNMGQLTQDWYLGSDKISNPATITTAEVNSGNIYYPFHNQKLETNKNINLSFDIAPYFAGAGGGNTILFEWATNRGGVRLRPYWGYGIEFTVYAVDSSGTTITFSETGGIGESARLNFNFSWNYTTKEWSCVIKNTENLQNVYSNSGKSDYTFTESITTSPRISFVEGGSNPSNIVTIYNDTLTMSSSNEPGLVIGNKVATTSSLGVVQPDGTSITVDSNGQLSCTSNILSDSNFIEFCTNNAAAIKAALGLS